MVLIGAGFVLAEDPQTVRGPDVSFVSAANTPAEGTPTGGLRRAPDLAVEVVSPSNTAGEIQEKVLDYLDADARITPAGRPPTAVRHLIARLLDEPYVTREKAYLQSWCEAAGAGDHE